MTQDLIRYDVLAQDALRGVVQKVLAEVAQTGLPGEHHFFVTFRTHDPGVRVSSRLREKYPQEMTIVLQHQFWDLTVGETAFEVGLSFNGIPERLHVPFRAIVAFVDPHASFGLKFDAHAAGEGEGAEEAAGTELVAAAAPEPDADVLEDERPAAGADVVSLDSFRKKNS